jgi:hypothetical protein
MLAHAAAVKNIYQAMTIFLGEEEQTIDIKVEKSKEEAAVITNHSTYAY